MTLWGTETQGPLAGITGDATLVSTAWVAGMSPRRLGSNALIDIQSDAWGNVPKVGGGQHNDLPIGPFVVTLSPIRLPNGSPLALAAATPNTDWLKMVARVVFGRGGTKTEVWVDWPMQGGSFVVACDTLSVNAMALDPNPALPTEPQTWDVRCGAWATPMRAGRAGNLPPRYTVKLPASIANGGGTSGEVFIPAFARRWHFQWNNLVSQGAWVINFLFRRYGITFAQETYIGGSATRSVLDTTIPGPWELPTEATTLVVNNDTIAVLAVLDGRIVFDLDLA